MAKADEKPFICIGASLRVWCLFRRLKGVTRRGQARVQPNIDGSRQCFRRSQGVREPLLTSPDERCLPDERALSVLGFPRGCLVCRHASSEDQNTSNSFSEPIPSAPRPWRRMPPTTTIEAPSKLPAYSGWHWRPTVLRARRPRTIPTAARAPGTIPNPQSNFLHVGSQQ